MNILREFDVQNFYFQNKYASLTISNLTKIITKQNKKH